MANSRDERYDDQESEYHFSDDQAAYEMEPDIELETEAPKAAPAPAAQTAGGQTGINRYRRMIIGVVVFVVVLFVVYKLIMPTTQSPADFSDAGTKAAPPAAPKQPVQPVAATATPAAPTLPAPAPASTLPMQQPAPPASAPAAPIVSALPAPVPAAPVAQPAPVPTVSPAQTMESPSPTNVSERLAALEQHNAQMQAENAQKIADTQAQTAMLQSKIQEMNSRLASMETNLNQLTQAILSKQVPQQLTSTTTMPSAPPPLKVTEPKIAYTVQAIIPGRAWLKSDAGDTITVAEGDLLKDYGRITKIDPYDGIVEIDTGAKTVTLSYGSTGE